MNADETQRRDARTADSLALALIALPFLQFLSIDFDRTAPLFLLVPGLVFGRERLAEAARSLASGPAWLRGSSLLAAIAVLISTAFADQPAPAIVTAASWILLAAAGLLVGRLVSVKPALGDKLLAGLAVGVVAGCVIVWTLWILGGRGPMPFYAHHRHLGLHALGGAVAATLLAVRAGTPARRLLWLAAGTIAWAGLFWSGGRGPVLALFAGLGLWFVLSGDAAPSPRFLGPIRRAILFSSLLQCLGGLALSYVFWTPRPELGWWHAFERTAAAAQAGDVSTLTSTRNSFWTEAAGHARTAPWFGHGPDAYRFLTPKLDGQQPHNFVLQLWLDLGLFGTIPILALLTGTFVSSAQRARTARAESAALGGWLALATALTLLGLLDGVFYHALAFLPAALAWGVAQSGTWGRGALAAAVGENVTKASHPQDFPELPAGNPLPTVVVTLAALILAFHAFLFRAVLVAEPPSSPRGFWPAVVRHFPSTTLGLWRWMDTWQKDQPDAALEWTRWATTHAANPIIFHVRAAQILLARGDRPAALAELRAAEAKAHWTIRPSVTQMIRETEAAQP